MNGTQTGTDWIGLIMASNEAALKWAEVFTGRPAPGTQAVTVTTPGGQASVSNMGGLLLLGGLAVVLVLVLRK